MANQVKESSIDYAYETIDAVVEAMDKVTAQPELAIQFVAEFLQKMPEIIDALMEITMPEHRQAIAKMMKASAGMAASWLKQVTMR